MLNEYGCVLFVDVLKCKTYTLYTAALDVIYWLFCLDSVCQFAYDHCCVFEIAV